ncbi:MAG: DegT/DnrJ/EryC1/StrS family aminotransferase [Planctomycetes bacterium]|nr:DegT/DnrJ/EryC1/StrS family aminotransferase [Planctomycetota bacterium]
MSSIPYGKQNIDEDDIQAVVDTLRSPFITTGPKVQEFERLIAEKVGAKYALAVSNGTVALHLACLALDLPTNYLGLTSPLTFAASANCILYSHGNLDLVDIEKNSPNLCPSQLNTYCTSNKVDLVIPVSYAGIPANMPAIAKLSKQYSFKTIEDASHALGSTYDYQGKTYHSGSCAHSDLAVFSFHPVKNIATAEGGMVLTNSKGLYEKLLRLRNHGMEKDSDLFVNKEQAFSEGATNPWYYEVQSLGFNGRLSELHAALGVSQMKKLESFKASRSKIVQKYNDAFVSYSILQAPSFTLDYTINPFYHLYPLRLKSGSTQKDRLELYQYLKENGIAAQVHYVPIHKHPHFQKHLSNKSPYLNSEAFYQAEISLPLFPSLTQEAQNKVIKTVIGFIDAIKQ